MIRPWDIAFGFTYVASDLNELIMVLYNPKSLISNTKDTSPRSLPRGSLGHVKKNIFSYLFSIVCECAMI